ncbi:MAG: cupredoxin domain-containing protein [Chloroflexi bacterium]|nr:cupredoxin domain-containing protein [Chloroflexota bacterium]MDA8237960.1 cupredoxin domain-containing protein [Chloroflexota bacterium]
MLSVARSAVLAPLVVLGLFVSACGGGQQPAGDIQVTLKDFAIESSTTTVSAGQIRLAISNQGPSIHEIEVFSLPTGVEPAALPVKDNVADTDSVGLTALDEVEDIAPQTAATLTVSLQPGRYALICNLPAHYGQGMYALLTVQ